MSVAKKIVAVVRDLMFTVTIQDAAKRAGVETVFVKSENEPLAQAKERPVGIIEEVNNATEKPLDVVAKLKNDEAGSDVVDVGVVSHVDAHVNDAAADEGCGVVMPRSAYRERLAAILKRYAEGS